jgi:hypothetical protein
MKRYIFNISEGFFNTFFKSVRTKEHVIEIIMNSIKYMIVNDPIKDEDKKGQLILYIDKMNRLFFISEDKYFSIAFPFITKYEKGEYSFSFKNNINIDHGLISQIFSIITCKDYKSKCSLDFATPITEYEEYDDSFWLFLKELLLMEDGYIRYDYDPINYKKYKDKDEEHKHPLHHYDLFYTSNATFKIGLERKISENEFLETLDILKDSIYIKD